MQGGDNKWVKYYTQLKINLILIWGLILTCSSPDHP